MSGLASSQAGPSTPIRALPSQLASKAAPSVPPASQSYEPAVKAVLRHRLLFRIFLYSALFSWAIVGTISVWSKGGLSTVGLVNALLVPWLPSTIAFALATWTSGVVPVVIARKVYLSALPTAAASPRSVFQAAVKKNSTARFMLVYTCSAIIIAFIHVSMAYAYEATPEYDPRLTLFVKSKKHPYYLNGRLLYLLSSQLFLAALFLSRNIMTDRFAVQWKSHSPNPEIRTFVLAQILTSFVTISLLVALSMAGHAVLFGLARSAVLPLLYRLPLLPRFIRPFSAHFLRGSWSLMLISRHVPLIYRTFLLGLITTLNWEFAESLFDAAVAEPAEVAHTTADPALTLVSGITSKDTYYKYFAYSELQKLASDASPAGSTRRTALFADQKYNPSMWSTLVRETLRFLGEDYQLLLRRGAPPAKASEAVALPKKLGVPPQVPTTPLIRTQVLRPGRPSPLRSALETFASDGPIASAVSSTAELGASQLPELFRSVIAPPSPSAGAAKAGPAVGASLKGSVSVKPTAAALPGVWKANLEREIRARAPKWLVNICFRLNIWWTRERVNKVVEAALPNRKMDALAVDALCSFVCASLAEDRYGVVQRDIPRILEALLSLLTAVEDYQNEIRTRYPDPTADEINSLGQEELMAKQEIAIDAARAGDVFSEIADPLKGGVVRVVRTFGDKLGAFKFAPRTARKLQGFVDYN